MASLEDNLAASHLGGGDQASSPSNSDFSLSAGNAWVIAVVASLAFALLLVSAVMMYYRYKELSHKMFFENFVWPILPWQNVFSRET